MLIFSSSFDVGLFAAQIPKPEEQKVIFIYLIMFSFLNFRLNVMTQYCGLCGWLLAAIQRGANGAHKALIGDHAGFREMRKVD